MYRCDYNKSMKMEECINYLLTQAQAKVNLVFRENLSQHNITPAQYAILYYLWDEDGLSPTHLAQLCGLDASTITGLLTRMEKKEFIQRQHCRDDRRGIHVYLTPQGLELRDKIDVIIEKSNGEAMAHLREDQKESLKDYLRHICESIGTRPQE